MKLEKYRIAYRPQANENWNEDKQMKTEMKTVTLTKIFYSENNKQKQNDVFTY